MEAQPQQPQPQPQPEPAAAKRPRSKMGIVLIVGGVILLIAAVCALIGGGVYGYQVLVVQPTGTAQAVALAQNATATAYSAQVATLSAQVTGTAQSRATATEIAGATSTARAQATATQVAAVTATADSILSAAHGVPSGWHLYQYETFDKPNSAWHTGSSSDEFQSGSASIEGGQYIWQESSKQGFVWSVRPNTLYSSDYYMSVDARLDSGYAATEYGLIFRLNSQTESYYLFSISNQATYELMLRNNNAWTELRSGASAALVPNQTNTIGVLAIGPQITLFVNGRQLTQLTDNTLQRGGIGVSILLPYGGLKATVVYDNYIVIGP